MCADGIGQAKAEKMITNDELHDLQIRLHNI